MSDKGPGLDRMVCAGGAGLAKRLSPYVLSLLSPSSLSIIVTVWWAKQYLVSAAATEAEVTEATACQVYEWLREVCSTTLLQTPIILGGPGIIVQIDESQFRHKPKV